MPWLRVALAALALAGAGAVHAGADPTQPHAPRMAFEPPAAGSYRLQRIQAVAPAMLQDASGRVASLSQLTRGKITLLSFFYTYCTDAWGCPYAYRTLVDLREKVLASTALASRVRFVNISFDPANDTPETLRLYAGRLHDDPKFEWRFLTARSVRELLPLLEDFGQDVEIERDALGHPTRTRNHMLKMFLIDGAGQVREIYALDFMLPQVLYNDLRTLAMEQGAPGP